MFGDALRQRLRTAGITQAELARRLDLNPRSVRRLCFRSATKTTRMRKVLALAIDAVLPPES